MRSDRAAFQDFERQGWDEVAAAYEQTASRVSPMVADRLVEVAGPEAGERVLDLACGPGFVAEAVARRGCVATGVDISSSMIELAAERLPGVEFRVGSAEAIPVDEGAFEHVISSFGLPHFADHAAAFREVRRVLAPGGRFTVATWLSPTENPFFGVILGALAHAGDLSVAASLPAGEDMFAYADPARLESDLAEAGFTGFTTSTATDHITTDDLAGDLERFYTSASVRSRALFTAQDAERQATILSTAVHLAEQLGGTSGSGTTLSFSYRVASARSS